MRIVTIIGARPQFIKAATVSRAICKHNELATRDSSLITEVIVHTGQHYDYEMSRVFFEELNIPEPDVNLGVGSGNHGWQTGQMLMHIEEVLLAEKPDWVLVYGDTNSTLAGALSAVKLHIPVAHVEAGLRSFNRQMPEEHNRVLTDHVSTLLFCPTEKAVKNLIREGFTNVVNEGKLIRESFPFSMANRLPREMFDRGNLQSIPPMPTTLHLGQSSIVINTGDVMYDSLIYNSELTEKHSDILVRLNLAPKTYALATVHRAENTDNGERLKSIVHTLEKIAQDNLSVIVPIHPRTRQRIGEIGLTNPNSATCAKPDRSIRTPQFVDPVSYLDMLHLQRNAKIILTDSGGVQKESFWLGVPCVTLRNETEWVELLELGVNAVAGSDSERIYGAYSAMHEKKVDLDSTPYGDGKASEKIVDALANGI
jgi:UDP-N-acetylglucosamine 2-epimerase